MIFFLFYEKIQLRIGYLFKPFDGTINLLKTHLLEMIQICAWDDMPLIFLAKWLIRACYAKLLLVNDLIID